MKRARNCDLTASKSNIFYIKENNVFTFFSLIQVLRSKVSEMYYRPTTTNVLFPNANGLDKTQDVFIYS